ncbi:hypothetical protein ILUMI_10240 [Ignelater luminosus]|uniref:Uncharacterized protein n=1 Tax=Ignelater luminosus TaxID=2038154 RepID=A0A8K0D2T2_IGNLU|nr:hypothetical protein ILUMI_10240 [Ignelater luminosus]
MHITLTQVTAQVTLQVLSKPRRYDLSQGGHYVTVEDRQNVTGDPFKDTTAPSTTHVDGWLQQPPEIYRLNVQSRVFQFEVRDLPGAARLRQSESSTLVGRAKMVYAGSK